MIKEIDKYVPFGLPSLSEGVQKPGNELGADVRVLSTTVSRDQRFFFVQYRKGPYVAA